MFSVSEPEVVGFSPAPPAKRETANQETQTAQVTSRDSQNQSIDKSNGEVQTEEVVTTLNKEFNAENLASFLTRVGPIVLNELDKLEKSKAYASLSNEAETESSTKQLYSLEVPPFTSDTLSVSVIDWSCTGNVLAVGFGLPYHSGWCFHETNVCFYNICKPSFKGEPYFTVKTKACVKSLAMHPYEPSIVAVGTHNGEVLFWNLAKDDLRNLDMGNILFHRDAVTQMCWRTINQQLYLVTSSLDGLMFLFKVSPSIGSVILEETFILSEANKMVTQPGITCFGFSSKPEGVFVAAYEGKGLVHGSISGAKGEGSSPKDPVIRKLLCPPEQVSSIVFSPHNDDLFLVTTYGMVFGIYSLKSGCILHEICASFDIIGGTWSLFQANTVLVWGSSNGIEIFRSPKSRLKFIAPDDTPEPDSILRVALTAKNPKLLALGSGEGKVYIWETQRF